MVDPVELGGSSLPCVHIWKWSLKINNLDQQGDLWLGMKGGLSIQVKTPRYLRSNEPGGI